ncbi:thioesterase family protein [Hyphobacterium sp. HN65]|uniref:Thioesterase family protein n=1 Tax=Hyphobacterium lacteum TaxID=3116575 RepID=A0ABU7LQE8_9PROT|nr:thioesterase family protein [Hyphobacterium sp. HN65]MEE2526132.1 thioesterase family protein [Hyphobacterium sp. HN65]
MEIATSFETAFLHRQTVMEGDIDFMGHVNNLVYLRWAAEMAERHWESVATPGMQAAGLWVVLRHEIDYLRELKLGEDVELRTWVDPVKGVRCPRHVDVRKAGSVKPSARVLTTWTFIDAETHRPKRLPPEMKTLFGM